MRGGRCLRHDGTSRSGNVLIEPRQLAADTYRMAKKPELPTPASWDIYRIASILLGTVEALNKRAALEKAAQEFKRGDDPPQEAKSPALISSANGHITWRSRPKKCGAS
jgi:hypothetical protein